MSGRRFRILSDSEDEETTTSVATHQKVTTDSNLGDFTCRPSKRRARIVAADSSEDEDEDGGGVDASEHESEHSVETSAQAVRTMQRRSSDENDGNRSEINESNGHRSQGSESRPQESDRGVSDGHLSDGNLSDRAHSDREDEAHDERPRSPNVGAGEAQETPSRKVVKKRVVKNPQPKLDAARLTGERGLGRLRNMHPHVHLKGKGHEREDLKCILHNLQLWGHRMFPKMQTKDIYERCGRLGTKMPVRVHLRRMRTGEIHDFIKPVIESDEDVARGMDGDGDPSKRQDTENRANFSEEEEQPSVGDSRDLFQELLEHSEPPSAMYKSENTQGDLATQDGLNAKIQAKRLEALKRREELRARREAQRRDEELLEVQLALEMGTADQAAL